MANTTITLAFKGKNTCIFSTCFMHGFTTAIVDVNANDNAKLVEKQSCWQPLFHMTVSSLFKIHFVSIRHHL